MFEANSISQQVLDNTDLHVCMRCHLTMYVCTTINMYSLCVSKKFTNSKFVRSHIFYLRVCVQVKRTHQMSRLILADFLLVQRATLSPFFLRDTTAPFTA